MHTCGFREVEDLTGLEFFSNFSSPEITSLLPDLGCE